jgi:hypothetical protein
MAPPVLRRRKRPYEDGREEHPEHRCIYLFDYESKERPRTASAAASTRLRNSRLDRMHATWCSAVRPDRPGADRAGTRPRVRSRSAAASASRESPEALEQLVDHRGSQFAWSRVPRARSSTGGEPSVAQTISSPTGWLRARANASYRAPTAYPHPAEVQHPGPAAHAHLVQQPTRETADRPAEHESPLARGASVVAGPASSVGAPRRTTR